MSTALNQNLTHPFAQLANKSSLTLTMESVLKRWVSSVVDSRVVTTGMLMHKNPFSHGEITENGNAALTRARSSLK